MQYYFLLGKRALYEYSFVNKNISLLRYEAHYGKHAMHSSLTKKITSHLDDEIRFFKSWINSPKAMGAVLPTSNVTAKKMASLIDENTRDAVLELGPGTGAITKAILARGIKPEQLYSVEYSEEFIDDLKEDFKGVNVLHGNAFELDDVLPDLNGEKFNTVISAIPMLCFPVDQRIELLNDLFDRLHPGRPVVQISYGSKSPIPPSFSNYTVEPLDWIARNFPPARLWVYRRISYS